VGKRLIVPMIKALIFDFDQTLVNSADGFRVAEKEVEVKIFHSLGITSWEEFLTNYRRIRKRFHVNYNFSRKAIWQEVYLHYHQKPNLQFLEKWECDYWEKIKSEAILFPETERVLENLTSRYQVALITNTQGQKTSKKRRLSQFPELEKFFKVIIVAGESGVPAKPNPAPFLLCLDNLGIAPPEAIYVGDDWYIDINGARNASIQPIWLQHHLVRRTWPTVETSMPVITDLNQLLDLI